MSVRNSNGLLLNSKQLIVVQTQLAKLIGLNEAAVLQQIHYWLDINEAAKKESSHFFDGHWWVYNTWAEWLKELPFRSDSTMRRTFRDLEANGLIIIRPATSRRGNWITINYQAVQLIMNQQQSNAPRVKKLGNLTGQNDQSDDSISLVKMTTLTGQNDHPVSNTETTQRLKDSLPNGSPSDQAESGIGSDEIPEPIPQQKKTGRSDEESILALLMSRGVKSRSRARHMARLLMGTNINIDWKPYNLSPGMDVLAVESYLNSIRSGGKPVPPVLPEALRDSVLDYQDRKRKQEARLKVLNSKPTVDVDLPTPPPPPDAWVLNARAGWQSVLDYHREQGTTPPGVLPQAGGF